MTLTPQGHFLPQRVALDLKWFTELLSHFVTGIQIILLSNVRDLTGFLNYHPGREKNTN